MTDFNYHGDVVAFDLDDTLMREHDFCRSGFELIRRRLTDRFGSSLSGIAMRMESQLRSRRNHFLLLERVLAEFMADEAELRSMMELLVGEYRSHRPSDLKLLPGVRITLQSLADRGVVMALVTDGRSIGQRNKIEALGLRRFIPDDNIYISEERGADKLQPDSFQAIVRTYPEAKRFIYVADNPRKDFRMPNLLGWTTCRVPHDPDNVHPLEVPESEFDAPTIEISKFEDLLTL